MEGVDDAVVQAKQSKAKQSKARGVVLAAIVLVPPSVLVSSVVFARVLLNTIDPLAVVSDDGRHLIVTGPFICDAGERQHLRLTVTQRSTGAVAEGLTLDTCTGGLQQWEVEAVTRGRERFEQGPATAVAIGRTTFRGATTDAHQWLVNITLVGE
jgi:hypothetical protein